MTPLVVKEVVLRTGKLSALQRKPVDRGNPFPCQAVRLRDEPKLLKRPPAPLLESGQRAQGRNPVEPGEITESRNLIEDGPALTLEGLRPAGRRAVPGLLETPGDLPGACRQPFEAMFRRRERRGTGNEEGLQNLPESRKRRWRRSIHLVQEHLKGVADPLQPSFPEDGPI